MGHPTVHEVQDKAQLVRRVEGIRHTHNERAVLKEDAERTSLKSTSELLPPNLTLVVFLKWVIQLVVEKELRTFSKTHPCSTKKRFLNQKDGFHSGPL